jgi:hypothetical protein
VSEYEPEGSYGGREYSVWRMNAPMLYDVVVSKAWERDSFTLHWLPTPPKVQNHYATLELLTATNSTGLLSK